MADPTGRRAPRVATADFITMLLPAGPLDLPVLGGAEQFSEGVVEITRCDPRHFAALLVEKIVLDHPPSLPSMASPEDARFRIPPQDGRTLHLALRKRANASNRFTRCACQNSSGRLNVPAGERRRVAGGTGAWPTRWRAAPCTSRPRRATGAGTERAGGAAPGAAAGAEGAGGAAAEGEAPTRAASAAGRPRRPERSGPAAATASPTAARRAGWVPIAVGADLVMLAVVRRVRELRRQAARLAYAAETADAREGCRDWRAEQNTLREAAARVAERARTAETAVRGG